MPGKLRLARGELSPDMYMRKTIAKIVLKNEPRTSVSRWWTTLKELKSSSAPANSCKNRRYTLEPFSTSANRWHIDIILWKLSFAWTNSWKLILDKSPTAQANSCYTDVGNILNNSFTKVNSCNENLVLANSSSATANSFNNDKVLHRGTVLQYVTAHINFWKASV